MAGSNQTPPRADMRIANSASSFTADVLCVATDRTGIRESERAEIDRVDPASRPTNVEACRPRPEPGAHRSRDTALPTDHSLPATSHRQRCAAPVRSSAVDALLDIVGSEQAVTVDPHHDLASTLASARLRPDRLDARRIVDDPNTRVPLSDLTRGVRRPAVGDEHLDDVGVRLCAYGLQRGCEGRSSSLKVGITTDTVGRVFIDPPGRSPVRRVRPTMRRSSPRLWRRR